MDNKTIANAPTCMGFEWSTPHTGKHEVEWNWNKNGTKCL